MTSEVRRVKRYCKAMGYIYLWPIGNHLFKYRKRPGEKDLVLHSEWIPLV